jgi:transposase
MTQVAWMIRRHLPNVLTYHRHRIHKRGARSCERNDPAGQETARGFRNADNFKTAIYFHCGGLDLYPLESR